MTASTTSNNNNGVEGVQVKVTLHQGKDLVAKDRNMMGKKTTSDPYVILELGTTTPPTGRSTRPKKATQEIGKTKTVMKTVNPEWNQSFEFALQPAVIQDSANPPTLQLKLFDYDKGTDDDSMGIVTIPLTEIKTGTTQNWYPVPKTSAKNAKGEVQVTIDMTVKKSTALQRGHAWVLPSPRIQVGLSWEVQKGKSVDLDAACVAITKQGQVSMENSVYYGNLVNANESIVHSGDSLDGAKDGIDESITFMLDQVPSDILALYLVLTVASAKKYLKSVASARVTITDLKTKSKDKSPMASFSPSQHLASAEATAMFLVRIARDGSKNWKLQPIEDVHTSARDFGPLIPHLKSYTRDLLPSIVVDPNERVSVLRKGGNIKVRDFCPSNALPDKVTFGLSWDMNRKMKQKIDLDASVICLDAELQCVDKVWFKHLVSMDGSIRHGGDERSGDKGGDDERIFINLSKVNKKTQYIGFVVNSYSGQELDDVEKASCHLFDSETGKDIAVHALSDCQFLDGHTALVMGVMYRVKVRTTEAGKFASDWCLKMIGQAAQGKTVKDLVDELQAFLSESPPSAPMESGAANEHDDLNIAVSMPVEVPILVEEE